ncbi:MAG: SH3 domain-containing protein [Planctomycetota bacterium]|jgi:uncharacterized protein YgiM (DUF1202 family)
MRITGVALLFLACVAQAEESYAAEVTASRLHLRAGPGSSYQSVILAEQGDRVIVREAAEGGWAVIEVPGGFEAWVSARFVARKGSEGTITVQNLLIRPRPSTRYHQLSEKLDKGETVAVLGEKQVGEDAWLRIRVPQRVPLYCSSQYLNKIGPASLATPKKAKAAVAPKVAPVAGSHDQRFIVIERQVLAELQGVRSVDDLRPIRRTVAGVDQSRLSMENQKRHIALERKLLARERELIVASVHEQEAEHLAELEKKIQSIEKKYQDQIRKLEEERKAKLLAKNRYTAVGIVEYKPHILGKTPAFRISEGGKLRYFLIAPAFDLHKFAGKRVGVTGMLDRESGTGYFTVMVKRIEIIGHK